MADNKKPIKDTPKREREFGVLLEDIDSNVKHIVEAVDTHTQQLQRLAGVPGKLNRIEARLDAVETILESVNLPVLKQKVVSLEKRVSVLEARQGQLG